MPKVGFLHLICLLLAGQQSMDFKSIDKDLFEESDIEFEKIEKEFEKIEKEFEKLDIDKELEEFDKNLEKIQYIDFDKDLDEDEEFDKDLEKMLHGVKKFYGMPCLLDGQCWEVSYCDRSVGYLARQISVKFDGECRPRAWFWIIKILLAVLFLYCIFHAFDYCLKSLCAKIQSYQSVDKNIRRPIFKRQIGDNADDTA